MKIYARHVTILPGGVVVSNGSLADWPFFGERSTRDRRHLRSWRPGNWVTAAPENQVLHRSSSVSNRKRKTTVIEKSTI